jgi:hypothetical protein
MAAEQKRFVSCSVIPDRELHRQYARSMARRDEKTHTGIAEREFITVLIDKLRSEPGNRPVGGRHGNLGSGNLTHIVNTAGMILMAVRNQQISNVGWIQPNFTNRSKCLGGVTFVQRIDHDQTCTRDEQIGAHEIRTNVVEIVEKLDGAHEFLRLGVGSSRALAISRCAELAAGILCRGWQCRSKQQHQQQRMIKQFTHRQSSLQELVTQQ